MQNNPDQFSSKIGFVLAAAGSAVGIGNLVGFPVAAAKNGGGAFLLLYIFFVVAICLPLILAELSMGRATGKSPLGAFREISKGHKGWVLAGALSLITPFMIAVFYSVLTVWLLGYFLLVLFGVQNVMFDLPHRKNAAQQFRDFYRGGTHKYRSSCCYQLIDFISDRIEFFPYGFINFILSVLADNWLIGRNYDYIKLINFPEFTCFGFCCTSHTGQLMIHPEIIL